MKSNKGANARWRPGREPSPPDPASIERTADAVFPPPDAADVGASILDADERQELVQYLAWEIGVHIPLAARANIRQRIEADLRKQEPAFSRLPLAHPRYQEFKTHIDKLRAQLSELDAQIEITGDVSQELAGVEIANALPAVEETAPVAPEPPAPAPRARITRPKAPAAESMRQRAARRQRFLIPILHDKELTVHSWEVAAEVKNKTGRRYYDGITANLRPDTRGKLAKPLGLNADDLPD